MSQNLLRPSRPNPSTSTTTGSADAQSATSTPLRSLVHRVKIGILLATFAFTASGFLAPSIATAQSASELTINAGRGAVPIVVPAGYREDSPAPLIVALHGYAGTGRGVDVYLQLSALADRYGFLFVAPDGPAIQNDDSDSPGLRYWNATSACCGVGKEEDDAAYLARLIASVQSKFRVDPKRVFLVGHSAGAFMAHRAAREYPGIIAAFVALAGTEEPGAVLEITAPVHALQIHGTSDGMITANGGTIQGLGDYAGALETVKRWAVRNDCASEGADTGQLDLVSSLDGAETQILRFTDGCRLGGSAELWLIDGGSHMPTLSNHFPAKLVEWLLGHPKP